MVEALALQGGEGLNKRRLPAEVPAGSRNIRFADFVSLLEALGFVLSRVNGSHHIFRHPQVTEPVNVQEVRGQVKPYQTRQVAGLIEAYGLTLGQDSDDSAEEAAQ
jgi:predicted RNA binding protein YcfA (HicA-like mRNA interferase family)